MKVQLITTFFHPISGGVEMHCLNLAKELQKKGHDVEVLCSDSDKQGGRLIEKETNYLGVKVRRFHTLAALSYYHRFYPGLLNYLRKNPADIIHVHGIRKNEGYLALLAARFNGAETVLTTHNPFPTKTHTAKQEKLIGLHDKTVGKWFTKNFSEIIALTQSELKILTERFNVPSDKISVIPNGVDEIFFQKGDAKNFYNTWKVNPDKWEGIVLGVGRMHKDKGFQNLKEAVNKLKHVLFVFVGGDDGYLEKLLALYRHNNNVLFTEKFIPQDKLTDYYAAADLLVVPSSHEAFGIIIIEALAAGVPVVSTNQGGPAEFLNDNFSRLLPPEEQQLWKDTIAGLLRNEKTLAKMSSAATDYAKQYKWSGVASQIEKVYRRALG